ncbi:MAG: STT3 domain-containing protein [Nanoarchaeota archaeon]
MDEDDTIDLSGITKLFKKKPKKQHVEHHPTAEKTKEPEEGDEISINWKDAGKFFKRFSVVLLILIPIVLSIMIRAGNHNLPVADDWARQSVDNYYRNQIVGAINNQYPNLPDENKNSIIDAEFTRFKAQNADNMKEGIRQTAQFFRQTYQDEDGHYFIPDIDPYFWYRYAKNVNKHGYPGDTIKDGFWWDDHMLAPVGKQMPSDMMHAYFLAGLFPVVKLFDPSVTLLDSIAYYPLIVSALAVLFIFLIGRKIAGNVGGLFAATFAAVTIPFVNRTLMGHADSDAWVVFFSAAITWVYLMAMDAKKPLPRLIFSALAGGLTGLFAFAWGGWWFILGFLVLASLAYLGFFMVAHRKELKGGIGHFVRTPAIVNAAVVLAVFFLVTVAIASLFGEGNTALTFPKQFFGITNLKAPIRGTLWPNVLTTVAELNPGNASSVVAQFGGKLVYVLALLGITLTMAMKVKRAGVRWGLILFSIAWFLLLSTDGMLQMSAITYLALLCLPIAATFLSVIYLKDTSIDPKYAILLTIWFVSTIYATIKGVRFTLMLSPAFSIAFGVCVAAIISGVGNYLAKELKLPRVAAITILVLLCGIILIAPARASYQMARSDVPIINQAWYKTLTTIRDDSKPGPENTVINSWWDFGHHFKALADRPVTFDGTTQDRPQAHWIGKTLLTDNEEQAVGILRMLDCGANNAFDTLFSITNDFHNSTDTLYAIFELDKAEALAYLTTRFGPVNANKVLQYTHCDPPADYFIASEDLIGKAGVWAHFGSWNFTHADIYQKARSMDKDEAVRFMEQSFGFPEDYAEQIYFEVQSLSTDEEGNAWIAPWPNFASGLGSCSVSGELADCGNGLTVNLTSMEPSVMSPQGLAKPKAFAYADKDGVHKKTYASDFPYGVALVPRGEGYATIFMQPELTASMFTVMFFYRGHGLKHFNSFLHETHFTGTDIYTYKVDWKGGDPIVMDEFVIKTEAKTGDTVTLDYVGFFDNQTVFDSSIEGWDQDSLSADFSAYANNDLSFTLGQGQVIPGFDKAVLGMQLDEEKTFAVDTSEGYTGSHPLANKTLHFRVKVVKIK